MDPPVHRRWPRPLGFLFFLWSLIAGSAISAVMVTLAFLTMPFDPTGDRVWFLTGIWARAILRATGVRVDTRVEGELPDGPCIFVCNHQGMFDILSLFVGLPRRFVFVAKKSVFRYPFIGWHMKAQGYVAVDRRNRRASIRSLAQAGERIRGGVSVCVFPEGTRSADGSILPFKKGPFVLALNAGVPVVPVALEGSRYVCPKQTWYLCPNTVRILLGRPLATAGLADTDRDDLMRRVRGEVIRMHRRLGGAGGDERNAVAAAGVEGLSPGAGEGA